MDYYVAVDIGASSGRIMLGYISNRKIQLEEIHRFSNGFCHREGYERWDISFLIESILIGLEKIKKLGIHRCVLGIDTWAVDYVLVDKQGSPLEDPISYRDKRTLRAVSKFEKILPLSELYSRTGIQVQPFNTLFQLFVEDTTKLSNADQIMLIPDYIAYVLTGVSATERTNASTTQLINIKTGEWDEELLSLAGVSSHQFPPLVESGSFRGDLRREKFNQFDLPDVTVINIGSHDTASAVAGIPAQGHDWLFLSSGTWSLLGKEIPDSVVTKQSYELNYSNELGVNQRYRFLKNIIGMWFLQELSRNFEYQYDYQTIAEEAAKLPAFQQFIDVSDPAFLNPVNMFEEIRRYCKETHQKVPQTIWGVARAIIDSLALSYAVEVEALEQLLDSNTEFDCIYIVGGGANNSLLNQLTADVTQMKVVAGPSEATALGNIIIQMVNQGVIEDLEQGRRLLDRSVELDKYEPQNDYANVVEKYKEFLKESKKWIAS